MPTQRPQLVNGEIYHVIFRAVGDAVIFNNDNDFFRGIFSLYEFNNSNAVSIWLRRQQRKKEKAIAGSDPARALQGQTLQEFLQELQGYRGIIERDLFVEILAFCLMPNHIHLLLRQLKDNGISQFMQKFGTGYAVYFNKKYERKGHLFNRFKPVHIKTNKQLSNIFVYIHINPLSLIEPGWKKNGIENPNKAINFLEEDYRWSSLFDYLGKENFPSLTVRNFLLEVMNAKDGCRESIKNWIMYKKELKDFGNLVLE